MARIKFSVQEIDADKTLKVYDYKWNITVLMVDIIENNKVHHIPIIDLFVDALSLASWSANNIIMIVYYRPREASRQLLFACTKAMTKRNDPD